LNKDRPTDVTCFIISLFNAQQVLDVNTSILRSLWLICWVISCVVLLWFDVCWCYGVVRLGWCFVVSLRGAVILCLLDRASSWWLNKDRPSCCHLFFISLFNVQLVSDVNTSIIRSLRIIIIIIINCNWVVTRWQWLFYMFYKTWNWLLINLSPEGYMRSM
jgi:hypothetical protein